MRKLAAIAFIFPLTFLAADAHATTISFGGNTYFLTSVAETWAQAEAEAVSQGGHLASIHSAADNQLLADTFVTGSPLWIGLADLSFDGAGGSHASNFFWSDGSAVDYTDWQGGEPNNANNNEYYTALAWHYAEGATSDKATWNDAPLAGSSGYAGNTNGPYYGIIEVANAPEPASFGLAMFGLAAAGFGALRRRAAR
ncbi:MAG TPA: lectin-like protein [Bryobacteraceae bacterium]|nr:lectin-like protein [Bryobacteraceae bacterium]